MRNEPIGTDPQRADQTRPSVSVSVVSHGHGRMLNDLLDDLGRQCGAGIQIILTLNIPETEPAALAHLTGPVEVIRNRVPKGFGANHNAAAAYAVAPYFSVVNPDVRLRSNPFPQLIADLLQRDGGVIAPLVVDSNGRVQDSARRFPSVASLLRKALSRSDLVMDYALPEIGEAGPDWVAGMFMLFPVRVFRELKGFDERYFLYYEDVDICARLRQEGQRVLLAPAVSVIHDPQRASRRSLRHAAHHARSMLRYLVRWRHLAVSGTAAFRP